MPNVMGREFPYTPEGMAQAEQYKQAMGMRGGGMMGFRPLGYADGNFVSDYKPLVQELYRIMSDGTDQQVRDFINSNRDMLNQATTIDDKMFNMLREVLPLYPPPKIAADPAGNEQLGMSIPQGEQFGPSESLGMMFEDNRQSEMMNRLGVANRLQDEIESGIPTRGSPTGPDLTGAELLSRLSPEEQELFLAQRRSAPVEMNRGGIMSLRGY